MHTCRRLAAEGAGTVFVTDNALTTLMCAPRSVYSWDIVINKADGKIWFDRRDQEGARCAALIPESCHRLDDWQICSTSVGHEQCWQRSFLKLHA